MGLGNMLSPHCHDPGELCFDVFHAKTYVYETDIFWVCVYNENFVLWIPPVTTGPTPLCGWGLNDILLAINLSC